MGRSSPTIPLANSPGFTPGRLPLANAALGRGALRVSGRFWSVFFGVLVILVVLVEFRSFWSSSGNARCRCRVVKLARALSGDGWGVWAGCLASSWVVLVDFFWGFENSGRSGRVPVVLVEFR